MKKQHIVSLILLSMFVVFFTGCTSTMTEDEMNSEAEILALEKGITIDEARNLVGGAAKSGIMGRSKERITWLGCSETDFGEDYYTYGVITVTYLYNNQENTKTFVDSCDKKGLKEYYCQGKSYTSTTYRCPEGCIDGACAQTQEVAPGPKSCSEWCIAHGQKSGWCDTNPGKCGTGCGLNETPDCYGGVDASKFCVLPESDTCCCMPKTTNCTDSDGGFNVELKGTCTDFNMSHTDECRYNSSTNTSVLREYVCSGGVCTKSDYSCEAHGYEKCLDGACIKKANATCTESDGGENIEVKGTCTDLNKTYTDVCVLNYTINKSFLREYSCRDWGICAKTEYDCEALGYEKCLDGACVKKANATCTDSDGGFNVRVRGTCVDLNKTYTDICVLNYTINKSLLKEYYCAAGGNFCTGTNYDCEAGGYKKCENGVCSLVSLNDTPGTPVTD